MPNKWYNRGRAFEYKVKKELETISWTVFRSAGSHTCADLVALRLGMTKTIVLLVQCKNAFTQYLPPKERRELRAVAKRLRVEAVVAYRGSKRGVILYSPIKEQGESEAFTMNTLFRQETGEEEVNEGAQDAVLCKLHQERDDLVRQLKARLKELGDDEGWGCLTK